MIPRTTSSRWLAGATVVVALLIAFSIVVAVLSRDREPELLPTGSPGRAVQEYILAVQREDPTAAYELLSREARERCGPGDIRFGPWYSRRTGGSFSVRLVDTEQGDDDAVVRIEVTEVEAPRDVPLFGGSAHFFDTTYQLVREQGEWRLDHPGWPGWSCPPRSTPAPPTTTTAEEP